MGQAVRTPACVAAALTGPGLDRQAINTISEGLEGQGLGYPAVFSDPFNLLPGFEHASSTQEASFSLLPQMCSLQWLCCLVLGRGVVQDRVLVEQRQVPPPSRVDTLPGLPDNPD